MLKFKRHLFRLRLLFKLYITWTKFPSLRFCQLVVNSVGEVNEYVKSNPCTLFYITDHSVENGLDEFHKRTP